MGILPNRTDTPRQLCHCHPAQLRRHLPSSMSPSRYYSEVRGRGEKCNIIFRGKGVVFEVVLYKQEAIKHETRKYGENASTKTVISAEMVSRWKVSVTLRILKIALIFVSFTGGCRRR
ncbi:hypothetical protein NPIL_264801 [Nephila pilipes]|uniref:Uncharacterized protein n=1 Tax=Nephila pilipes TaxID=299642 RepID=A0A8X6NXI9_NEPPI|nr:hypothetical protein NPIL_264801 [Nephila pilipes]